MNKKIILKAEKKKIFYLIDSQYVDGVVRFVKCVLMVYCVIFFAYSLNVYISNDSVVYKTFTLTVSDEATYKHMFKFLNSRRLNAFRITLDATNFIDSVSDELNNREGLLTKRVNSLINNAFSTKRNVDVFWFAENLYERFFEDIFRITDDNSKIVNKIITQRLELFLYESNLEKFTKIYYLTDDKDVTKFMGLYATATIIYYWKIISIFRHFLVAKYGFTDGKFKRFVELISKVHKKHSTHYVVFNVCYVSRMFKFKALTNVCMLVAIICIFDDDALSAINLSLRMLVLYSVFFVVMYQEFSHVCFARNVFLTYQHAKRYINDYKREFIEMSSNLLLSNELELFMDNFLLYENAYNNLHLEYNLLLKLFHINKIVDKMLYGNAIEWNFMFVNWNYYSVQQIKMMFIYCLFLWYIYKILSYVSDDNQQSLNEFLYNYCYLFFIVYFVYGIFIKYMFYGLYIMLIPSESSYISTLLFLSMFNVILTGCKKILLYYYNKIYQYTKINEILQQNFNYLRFNCCLIVSLNKLKKKPFVYKFIKLFADILDEKIYELVIFTSILLQFICQKILLRELYEIMYKKTVLESNIIDIKTIIKILFIIALILFFSVVILYKKTYIISVQDERYVNCYNLENFLLFNFLMMSIIACCITHQLLLKRIVYIGNENTLFKLIYSDINVQQLMNVLRAGNLNVKYIMVVDNCKDNFLLYHRIVKITCNLIIISLLYLCLQIIINEIVVKLYPKANNMLSIRSSYYLILLCFLMPI